MWSRESVALLVVACRRDRERSIRSRRFREADRWRAGLVPSVAKTAANGYGRSRTRLEKKPPLRVPPLLAPKTREKWGTHPFLVLPFLASKMCEKCGVPVWCGILMEGRRCNAPTADGRGLRRRLPQNEDRARRWRRPPRKILRGGWRRPEWTRARRDVPRKRGRIFRAGIRGGPHRA